MLWKNSSTLKYLFLRRNDSKAFLSSYPGPSSDDGISNVSDVSFFGASSGDGFEAVRPEGAGPVDDDEGPPTPGGGPVVVAVVAVAAAVAAAVAVAVVEEEESEEDGEEVEEDDEEASAADAAVARAAANVDAATEAGRPLFFPISNGIEKKLKESIKKIYDDNRESIMAVHCSNVVDPLESVEFKNPLTKNDGVPITWWAMP